MAGMKLRVRTASDRGVPQALDMYDFLYFLLLFFSKAKHNVGRECCLFFFQIFYCYWFQSERNGGIKRGREKSMWKSNIDHLPFVDPWLGIEPVTFSFVGRCPINWATLARADFQCIDLQNKSHCSIAKLLLRHTVYFQNNWGCLYFCLSWNLKVVLHQLSIGVQQSFIH